MPCFALTPSPQTAGTRRLGWASVVALVIAAGPLGCAKPPAVVDVPKAAAPVAAPVPAGDADLKGAARLIAADLAQQVGVVGAGRTLVIDPFIDRGTGQQTGVSALLQAEFATAILSAMKGLAVLPFDGDGTAKARFIVAGTVSVIKAPDRFSASVSLTDRPTRLVVAQAAARFVQAGLDASPTRFYNDSPSLVRDRSVDAYVRTAETKAGAPADELYVSQVSTAALLAEALAAYNLERWEQSLALYNKAASQPDGHQLRTFNGIYLANVRLGRLEAAEQAFGMIVTLGLATNNLSVKILFKPNSSKEFWPGSELGDIFPMWVRQIARATQATGSCLNIVGHTSRSGSEAFNDTLSLARAETVKRLMIAEARDLATRLQSSGVGFRENLIGTGTDDSRDAPDRRVEFKVVPCKQ